jgi:hypothetical protein
MQSDGDPRESIDSKASVLPQLLSKALARAGLLGKARGGRDVAMPPFDESYNLLFCDDVKLFQHAHGASAVEPWATLLSKFADVAALRRIAESESENSRARVLAYRWLHSAGIIVASKCVLAFIVEVPVDGGLDVLAAYADGRVCYLHHSGETITIESPSPRVAALTADLARSGHQIVDKVDPWNKRLPPPKDGRVRLTFVVSNGLYFCEGSFAELQRDTVAGPLLQRATEVLELLVELRSS